MPDYGVNNVIQATHLATRKQRSLHHDNVTILCVSSDMAQELASQGTDEHVVTHIASHGSIIELSPDKPVLVSLHAEALQPLSEHLDKREPADVIGGTSGERFVYGVISKITPKRCEIRIEALDMVLDWQAWRIKAYLQSPPLQKGQIEIRKEKCEAFAVTANPSPSTSPTRTTPISLHR